MGKKKKVFYKLHKLGIFILILAWLFSGWPVLWQDPRIPPKVKEAKADTAYYYPTSDVAANWDCTGSGCTTGHFEVLNESTLDTTDFISAAANSGLANDEHQIDAITESGINYLRLHYYAETGNRAQIDIMLQSNGTTQVSYSLPPNSSAAWRYIQWDTSSVGTITGEFAIVNSGTGKPGNGTVYAWYIEVNYTPSANISVSIDDGVITYDIMPTNTSKSTLPGELNDMQTATNDGDVTENFNIKGYDASGGGCTWTLAGTNGSDQYVHQFCNDTDLDCSSPPTNYTALTTTYQTLDTNIPVSGTVDFQLRITVPTESSCFGEQSVNVTVQAVQP